MSASSTAQRHRVVFPFGGFMLFIVSTALLVFGWQVRDERYLTAEYGLGYALGIIGGSMMLLLLLYPLRKHWRVLRRAGPISWWFRIHMMFGVFGPIAILYHCSFHQGSLNSTVALWSMIIVAGSGVFGRIFYSKIHYGLYGGRMTLQELRKDSSEERDRFAQLAGDNAEVDQLLKDLDEQAQQDTRGVLHGIYRVISMGARARKTRRRITPLLKRGLVEHADAEGWDREKLKQARKELKEVTREYFNTITRVSRLGLYERLFSWWHILHLPLFIMLVISGFTHVIAVNRY